MVTGNWAVIIFTIFLLGLSGCGVSNSENANSDDETNTTKKNGSSEETSSVPSCPTVNEGLFTVLPLHARDFTNFVPLGNLNPPAHTYPTDHHYFYLTEHTQPVPVYAPASIRINYITRSEHLDAGITDYQLSFSVCQDVQGLFDHVSAISDTLASATNDFSDADCEEYSTGGETYRHCGKEVNIELSAGDRLGTAGGNISQYALDFGVYDDRITHTFANQTRFENNTQYLHAMSAIPYFDSDRQDSLKAVAGNGIVTRTEAPVGGTIEQDKAGTAQGIWIKKEGTTYPEDPNLALVHDNIDPTVPVFSIGNSLAGLNAGTYSFTPSDVDSTNRDFSDVVPGETIYLYKNLIGGPVASDTILLLRLVDSDTLWLEAKSTSEGPPWSFSTSKVEFVR